MTRALSPRQRQIIECASRGLNDRETAEALGSAVATIRTHRSAILRRLNARTTAEACVLYERERAANEAREQLADAIDEHVFLKGAAY